jgi:hypothetical protein
VKDIDEQKLRRIRIGTSVIEAIPIALPMRKWLHKA